MSTTTATRRAAWSPGIVADDAWFGAPLRLADEVSVLVGANDQTMLCHAGTGVYVRLSPSATALLPLLDGTRTGTEMLAAATRTRGPEGTRDRSEPVRAFLADLRAAGMLNVAPRQVRRRSRMRLRFSATGLNRILRGPAGMVRRFPRTGAGFAIAATLLAAALAATALGTPPVRVPILAVAALLLVQVILHESAHALTCLALGTPIREFGIKLWCLVLPAPYVDRTDAYRLRRRTGRVVIALAGPFVDLLCAGASGAVVLLANGPPAQLARALLALQLFVLATNLNPLLPSDGHQAIEAGLGELNIRHRATTYLTCRLLRRPLPAAYRDLTRGRRRLYLTYALLSLGYLALFLLFLSAVALTWLLH